MSWQMLIFAPFLLFQSRLSSCELRRLQIIFSPLVFRVSTRERARFEIRERFLEIFLRGVCSWKSNRFAFDKTSFDTWWVTGSVMCVLKCFSRFIVNFYVKDSVFLESFSFVNNRIKECDFLVWNSAVNFIVGWKLFACSRNKSTSCLSMSHRDVPLSMKRFHTVG